MKKYIIRIMCLMILAIFLCGCGKEEEEGKGQDVSDTQSVGQGTASSQKGSGSSMELPEGYALYAHYEDAGKDKEMHRTCLVGSSLYYYTHNYDSVRKRPVQDLYVQEEGKEPRQLLSFGYEDGKRVRAMASGGEGCLFFLYSESTAEDESQVYTLEKRDQELQIVYSVDTTEDIKDMEDVSFYGIYDMEVGADGHIYGLTITGNVLCWDETGAYQGCFTLPVDLTTAIFHDDACACFGLASAGDSGVYAYWKGEDQISGNSLHLYNVKKWMEMDEAGRKSALPLWIDFEAAAEVILSSADMFIFSGYGDGLYLGEKDRLWRIDVADGSLEPLLVWDDIGLRPEYVTEIHRNEDGGFLMYVLDTLEEWNYWVTLEPVPASEIPQKHELVLGVAGISLYSKSLTSKIEQVVLSYNRIHPYCQIKVREYEQSDIMNFQTELLTGKGPDILLEMESFFDMETLAGKGIVEDLAPYLANSEGISEDDILPGILDLVTKDGKISRIPLSFSVDVMILPEGMGQEVLAPQEMVEFMSDSEYRDYLVYSWSFLLQILSGAEMDHYVDKEKKSCSFDSGEFVGLLESLARLGDLEMIGKRWDRADFFHSGQLKAIVEEMSCLKDYFCIREAFSGVGEIAGFPNSGGELRYPARPYDWMGINSATEYKEDAWSFIEFCLSYMSHSDDVSDRFVVTKDKFYQQTHFEKEALYLVVLNFYDGDWEGWQTIEPMTQEQTDLLWEISEHLFFYEDDDLLNVIGEEAEAFFAGDISAQEAAKRIQSRASLVVGE